MKLSAVHQPPGDVGRLQQGALSREMRSQEGLERLDHKEPGSGVLSERIGRYR